MIPDSTAKGSPIITKPTDPELLVKLERKLIEYRKRLSKSQDGHSPGLAYQVSHSYRDALFKSIVLERLLTAGQVVTWDLSLELNEKYGPFDLLEVEKFNEVCTVIATYCGQNDGVLLGGTGLK